MYDFDLRVKVKLEIAETARSVLGYRKKIKKWITAGTWNKITERKKIKEKLISTKSPQLKEQVQSQYREKDKEVKRSARKDKRAYLDNLAREAEHAASRGHFSTVYKITKRLCKPTSSQAVPIRDKNGKQLTSQQEQAERCVEHFRKVLNQPEPQNAADPTPPEELLNIDCTPPTVSEIEAAIKKTKIGKAPGIDGLQAELLKADTTLTARALHKLFTSIWQSEAVPRDWCKGLIIRIPKKGDLRNCDNWRGVTLLSIPSKIFCRILLCRIDKVLDPILREEQAGFRRGRGCIDQIFTLRNIIEQCLEWKTPLHINFIDFRKAFDSVHRESLWRILAAYGLPPKMLGLLSAFYDNFECSIYISLYIDKVMKILSWVQN